MNDELSMILKDLHLENVSFFSKQNGSKGELILTRRMRKIGTASLLMSKVKVRAHP